MSTVDFSMLQSLREAVRPPAPGPDPQPGTSPRYADPYQRPPRKTPQPTRVSVPKFGLSKEEFPFRHDVRDRATPLPPNARLQPSCDDEPLGG